MKRFLLFSAAFAVTAFAGTAWGQSAADSFGSITPNAGGIRYYVSGGGKNSNNGRSQSRPFRTLQHAANQTRPGDTVFVMDGVYRAPGEGSTVLSISTSGRPGQWIRYRALPGHNPHIKVGRHWSGILVDGAAYVTVEGFKVEGSAPNVSLGYALSQKSNLENPRTSHNCIAVANKFIRPSQFPHHVIIRGNHAFNCPGAGIYTKHADYIRIDDNLVHHNAFYSPYANSGISVYLNSNFDRSTQTKIFIRNNISHHNENKVPHYYSNEGNPGRRIITDGNGIIVDDTRNVQSDLLPEVYTGATLVQGNFVYENGGRGIITYLSDHVVIKGNRLLGNARTGNMDADLRINESANVTAVNNVIAPRPDRQAIRSTQSAGLRVKNNRVYE